MFSCICFFAGTSLLALETVEQGTQTQEVVGQTQTVIPGQTFDQTTQTDDGQVQSQAEIQLLLDQMKLLRSQFNEKIKTMTDRKQIRQERRNLRNQIRALKRQIREIKRKNKRAKKDSKREFKQKARQLKREIRSIKWEARRLKNDEQAQARLAELKIQFDAKVNELKILSEQVGMKFHFGKWSEWIKPKGQQGPGEQEVTPGEDGQPQQGKGPGQGKGSGKGSGKGHHGKGK